MARTTTRTTRATRSGGASASASGGGDQDDDDALISGAGAIEAEAEGADDAMAMEEAMTMIAAGDLNDLSDHDDDNEAEAEDEDMLGAMTTTTTTATATMDLPVPALPPLPGLKPPPEAAMDNDIDSNSKATYYAVRVGYAVCPSCNNSKKGDDDGVDESSSSNNGGGDAVVVSTIRSAIFLRWEDVKQFVEFVTTSASSTQPSTEVVTGEATGSGNSKVSGASTAAAAAGAGDAAVRIPFHRNVEYKVFNDLHRAERYLTKVSTTTSTTTTLSPTKRSSSMSAKPKSSKLKSSSSKSKSFQIKSRLTTLPAKSFNPITKKWQSMFDQALKYKATHGNLDVPSSSKDANFTQYEDLSKWIKYQRASYRGYLEDPMGGKHSMTEEKVNQLKAVGFAWIYSDRKAWLEEGGESNEKRKRGRPRKTLKMAATEAAVVAYRGPINLPNKPIRAKWLQMLQKLKDYKERTGSVYVSDEETDEELVLLRLWVKGQKNLYSRMRQGYDVGMTQEKADVSAGKDGLYY